MLSNNSRFLAENFIEKEHSEGSGMTMDHNHKQGLQSTNQKTAPFSTTTSTTYQHVFATNTIKSLHYETHNCNKINFSKNYNHHQPLPDYNDKPGDYLRKFPPQPDLRKDIFDLNNNSNLKSNFFNLCQDIPQHVYNTPFWSLYNLCNHWCSTAAVNKREPDWTVKGKESPFHVNKLIDNNPPHVQNINSSSTFGGVTFNFNEYKPDDLRTILSNSYFKFLNEKLPSGFFQNESQKDCLNGKYIHCGNGSPSCDSKSTQNEQPTSCVEVKSQHAENDLKIKQTSKSSSKPVNWMLPDEPQQSDHEPGVNVNDNSDDDDDDDDSNDKSRILTPVTPPLSTSLLSHTIRYSSPYSPLEDLYKNFHKPFLFPLNQPSIMHPQLFNSSFYSAIPDVKTALTSSVSNITSASNFSKIHESQNYSSSSATLTRTFSNNNHLKTEISSPSPKAHNLVVTNSNSTPPRQLALTRPEPPPRFQCDACQKSYSTFNGLTKHKEFHCSTYVKKQFLCPHCETKSYTSLGALKMHIRTHTLPCKCKLCGKAFSRPWLLQGHLRTHTGERPFECSHCSRAFADRSNLRAHLQTHCDVKRYHCQLCNKSFSRMSLLLKHKENQTCS